MTSVDCECEACRLMEAFGANGAGQAAVAHDVYWSITCARCGDRVPFAGIGFVVCESCEVAVDNEIWFNTELAVNPQFKKQGGQ